MKPLGFWFAHLHQALETSLEEVLAAETLTRRHWQVLDTIDGGARGQTEVDQALSPFGEQQEVVADLRTRGWIDDEGDLTAQGHEAHARLKTEVGRFRSRATEGISEDDYRTTVGVLERMAANLARE
ncbi:MarR family transcriptional regulator [Amycolatopsis pittospori]|uniref:MarR family transcriptional regulator n=1 Tax=Amycolatopsis pittospori TaxID=2749434 RepID=UPI0015F004F9|nr:MarR family transcriptional regulator [Amycolatopsis pittospori]